MHSSPEVVGDADISSNTGHETHSSFLLALGQHDNDGHIVLPDHPPEVSQSVLQWTLSGYEGIAVMVALGEERNIAVGSLWLRSTHIDEAGIDVVGAFLGSLILENHSSVLI